MALVAARGFRRSLGTGKSLSFVSATGNAVTVPRFEEFNETDVREEIIAPLLRSLGYRSGTVNNIVREQSLRYSRSYLGRKNPARDPELRGIADYILDVNHLVRWVIEAKPPSVDIAADEIEQAWSYANHPEVRAVYFSLCNGRVLHVFQTQHGPEAGPILTLTFEQMESDLSRLVDILSPAALLRDFPDRKVDQQPPIGPGLRSVARISQGWIRYDYNNLENPALNHMQTGIPFGAVQRGDDGGLIAYLETLAPLRTFQEWNERLGLTSFEMRSYSSALSIDPKAPTRFTSSQKVVFPAGVPMLDIKTWREMKLPFNLDCHTDAIADGSLSGNIFSGRFIARMCFVQLKNLVAELSGPFQVHVS